MNSDFQTRLVHCIVQSIRPLARVMLRAGIGYGQFAELAKLAFLQEALAEKDYRGRSTNLSRVAIRTGISRKEAARLRKNLTLSTKSTNSDKTVDHRSLHTARVLQLWHSDPRFIDGRGAPRHLPFADSDVSFTALVKAAGGDVPAGAVRAELLMAGAVAVEGDGALSAIKRYFVPADVGEELVVGFTHMIIPVLEGVARNTDDSCASPFIQRLVYSDRLSADAQPLFRRVAREQVTNFVQSVDDWLSANEDSSSESSQGRRFGIGVFYYEGDPSVPTRRDDGSGDA